MASIRIFAPGTHRSSQGEELTFSAEDVAGIVASYDPSKHQAPLVRGHPKDDDPALGWVERLAVHDGHLVAEFGDVDAAVKSDVDTGRFRFVSSAFYRPDERANPTPGKWYLRHVGLLGAVPPAVKGLGRAQFDDAGAGFVDVAFGERPGLLTDALHRISWAFSGLATALRGQRERVIEAQGVEEADKTAPGWQVDQLSEAAAELRSLARSADTGTVVPARFSESETDVEEDAVTDAEMQAELDRLRAENQALSTAESRRQADAAHAANVSFAEGLAKDAKLPQGQVETVVSLLDHLGPVKPEKEVTFSDAEGKAIDPAAALKTLLSGLAPKVAFTELVTPDGERPAVAFSVPTGDGYLVDQGALDLHRRAIVHAEQNKVPYAEAVKAVGGR